MDKRSGATTARPGLHEVPPHARAGDVLVVHTPDRLGLTVRDSLNPVYELKERGVGIKTLADPLAIDTTRA
ncbi:DNA invertase Pin-like site-specific DNA recombinase [Arthrobacter sp. UYCu712]